MLAADEGYYFGLGAFETIAVEEGKVIFLEEHLERLEKAAEFFQIPLDIQKLKKDIENAVQAQNMQTGRKVIKLTISQKNVLLATRENTYKKEDYEKGFIASYSGIRRNETSPLTYHKTLNYGDCILEKRRVKSEGIQEPIFLNTRGEIAEGATTNVFFVKEGCIYAPPLSCGMLPGIMRQYLYKHYEVQEKRILPEMVEEFDEMFLTNSLLGIMPVVQLEQHVFSDTKTGRKLLEEYRQYLKIQE